MSNSLRNYNVVSTNFDEAVTTKEASFREVAIDIIENYDLADLGEVAPIIKQLEVLPIGGSMEVDTAEEQMKITRLVDVEERYLGPR